MVGKMTYSFKCNDCDSFFDASMTIEQYTKHEKQLCPYCKSKQTVRVFIKLPAVVYKGEGFTKAVKEE